MPLTRLGIYLGSSIQGERKTLNRENRRKQLLGSERIIIFAFGQMNAFNFQIVM